MDNQSKERFYAYYYSLEATGLEPVDNILEAVAHAGKSCHNTEDWAEYGLIENIQTAADQAKQSIREAIRRAKHGVEDEYDPGTPDWVLDAFERHLLRELGLIDQDPSREAA